ncbi:hypothetical protein ACJMK2_014585 [Sinanodonta woodiana]|uniref:Uncharacterized protein n=1 Tax=Sinanodonta woodiana TaxID=1069815 RepID=A0ABD3V154_SINWO
MCVCVCVIDRIKGAENSEVINGMFSWYAGQDPERDPNTIEISEIKKACRYADKNNKYVAKEEIVAMLTELNLPSSRYAEELLWRINLGIPSHISSMFENMDKQGITEQCPSSNYNYTILLNNFPRSFYSVISMPITFYEDRIA